ncbi:MAG: ribonuclease HI [Candidatus Melainabacteria bacterium]|nr:ribonuclease HI [Candidatus Melainabacteria bacterium]
MTLDPSSILIYTDGACTGNPGPGGWACIVSLPDGSVHELGGGVNQTTNNRMEMAAAIRALAMLEPKEATPIVLYTDSSYVIKGITQWIWGWRSRGWKSADGKDVANRELWEELLRQVTRLKPSNVEWRYVRGHSGYAGNERCDEIAVSFAKNKPDQLYVGPRDGYFIDLSELPATEALLEQKKSGGAGGSKSGSKSGSSGRNFGPGSKSGGGGGGSGSGAGVSTGPTTYLSYHNGVLQRHSTWSDCERRVKGQSGAKFKKAKSDREEREILLGWGLDPQTRIE